MNLTELRKLAEAAQHPSVGVRARAHHELVVSANVPATILAMCDLLAQCKEALSVANTNMYFKAAVDALAAIAKFEGEK